MAYNSSAFNLSATTTETSLNLPTMTSSILLVAPSTNTDTIKVRLGGGSPIILRSGQAIALSIEVILQTLVLTGQVINPQILMTQLSYQSTSGTQLLDVYPQEWRLS